MEKSNSKPEITKNAENYFGFDFKLVKEYLETILSYNAKIAYLY